MRAPTIKNNNDSRRAPRRAPRSRGRRAYGLAETAISVIIVAGMMVAALNAAGASRVGQRVTSDGAKGSMLATALMSEIMEQKYVEPTEPSVLGLEVSELLAANRTVYDDVDDYDGLSDSPPKNRDGSVIPQCSGWTCSVAVVYVSPTDMTATSGSDTGVKRITVTVTHNNLTVKTLTAVKCSHSTILGNDGEGADAGGGELKMTKTKHHSRRASVYVLVLSSSTLLAVMGLGALTAMRIERRNITGTTDFAEARMYARSAIEMGLYTIANDPNWRTTKPNGNWRTDQPIGQGTYTLNVVDPTDANLADSMDEPLILTGVGMKGEAQHRLSVTLTSDQVGLSCLQTALHAHGNITFPGAGNTVLQTGSVVSSNATVTGSGADIYCDVEAAVAITGSAYRAGRTAPVAARAMPNNSSVFSYYTANGSSITFTAIPSANGIKTIERVLISPSSPQYGASPNAQGIYVINCGGSRLRIRDCRIVGTLLLVNPAGTSTIEGSVLMESAGNLPCLMVSGPMQINISNGQLDESSGGNYNFNPIGTPYNGQTDNETDDSYPSIIKGLVYVSGALTTDNYVTVNGAVVVGTTLSMTGTLDLTYDNRFYNSPPPGFDTPPVLSIQPGAWRQSVN